MTNDATLTRYISRLEALARRQGLDFYAVDFEMAPSSFMLEISVYGLPVRMAHWSYGVRYIHQLVRQSMGYSKIFEVMFPGDPCHAYLAETNSIAEQALVAAHVLGHADFAKNNQLFSRFHEMAGGRIVEQAAAHAHAIDAAIQEHGLERVEAVLDAALSLECHIDVNRDLYRPPYPEQGPSLPDAGIQGAFQGRFAQLPGASAQPATAKSPALRPPLPPHPEYDLLWFVAQYAPEMEPWERDIFLAVRQESFYFYPVFACQIMNEGWASYWHARLLREADFLPQELYVEAIKAHSDVVRPHAGDEQTAIALNPYHLGFSIWESLIESQGLPRAQEVRRDEDDFGFIRNYLDRDLAEKLRLLVYEDDDDGSIIVAHADLNQLREAILAPKFNYGAPRVAVSELRADGTLELFHDFRSDGRGLDLERATKVLEYIARVWRRPVRLLTSDSAGQEHVVTPHEQKKS
ncbi:MAG TPA: SpoVR family protein [Woeseiaceae bacterium]|jgi:stage V sporulation protein R|nr:SpoVR family protein [Woeseiaceae bacterium]